MNKESLLALGLTEEQATQVLEGYKGYIPSDRFNEVNEAKKAAEAVVAERDKQLAELKKAVGDNEDLKSQIETLQQSNKEAQAKYEADLKALKIESAINQALTESGAKLVKAVRPYIELEKITLEGDEVKGIKEQLEALKSAEDTKFLFGETKVTGVKGAEGNPPKPKPVSQMTYSEMMAHLAQGGSLE